MRGSRDRVPQAEWDGPEQARAESEDRTSVSIFGGLVSYWRPSNWVVRRYSSVPGSQFVEYISPRGLLVVISERPERGDEPWERIVNNLRDELRRAGHEEQRGAMPMVVGAYQARFLPSRKGQRRPADRFATLTQDYLIRNRSQVILLQVSYESGSEGQAAEESRLTLGSLALSAR